nr:MAG TPA: hypothetical protein [Caudoviricetes sp.]
MLGLTICFQMDYPMDMTFVMSYFFASGQTGNKEE